MKKKWNRILKGFKLLKGNANFLREWYLANQDVLSLDTVMDFTVEDVRASKNNKEFASVVVTTDGVMNSLRMNIIDLYQMLPGMFKIDSANDSITCVQQLFKASLNKDGDTIIFKVEK